jgi:hypothetical protein
MKILSDRDTFDDSSVKNKFRWEWFQNIINGVAVGNWARKVVTPGLCMCILCNHVIKYGSSGKKSFESHANSVRHCQIIETARQTVLLPEAAPAIANQQISVSDRKCNQDAMVLGFMLENRLPAALAPALGKLVRQLAIDPLVAKQLSISTSSACYKARDGLGQFYEESLAVELRSDAFSLTLDESTSESGQRVLCILVQHFVNYTLVVDNLRCCSLPRVDAASIVCATKSTLDELQIPLQKVVSIFSDGCNVMRGKNNGVFAKVG